MTTTNKTIFVQNWEESERGWGVSPNGFTVHISKDQHHQYITWFYETFNNSSEIPDEYTRVSGDCFEVEVAEELFNKIKQATQSPRDDGAPMKAVHGHNSYLSPKQKYIEDSDIDWPMTPL